MEWTKEKADACMSLKAAKTAFFQYFNISSDEEAMITIGDAEVFLAGYAAGSALPTAAPVAKPLLLVDFTGKPDGLVTSEYAFWSPGELKAKTSKDWEMTSGSLFAKGGKGWTGVPDEKAVDIASATGNNSRDFRLTTRRQDFGDVSVKFELTNVAQSAGVKFPAVAWDGVHVFLRYQSQTNLYYASVNRRDGKVIIKKKITGGPGPISNGGTYYPLTPETPIAWTPGVVQNVEATVKNQPDGSVLLTLNRDGKELLRVVDDGKVGGPPITEPGATGIRGDNTEFTFNKFKVETI